MTTTSFSPKSGQDFGHGQDDRHALSVQTRRLHLRSRLAEVDALIAALSAERQSLQAESDSIIYPVLSLPTEITMEIFRRCVSSSDLPSPSPTDAPLLLAQICRQWRDIALNTPDLWQSLFFRGNSSSAELLKLWLSRAGNLPLNCTIYCTSRPQADTLIEAVMLHSDQWQDLSFGLPLTSLPMLHMPHRSLPMLRKISLEIHSQSSDEEVRDPIIISNAPLLREVHIYTLPDAKFDIFWQNLTTLKLFREVELVKCLTLLRECPDLVHLSVDTTGSADRDNVPLLTLHHMESLASNLGDTFLLQHLTLPRLRRLTVTGGTVASQHATHLESFVRRSACTLEFLSVPVADVTSDTLRRWLRTTDSVTAVKLTWGPTRLWDGDVLLILESEILPRLRILHIQGGRLSREAYDVLLRVLRTRRRASPGRAILDSLTLDIRMHNPRHKVMPTTSTIAHLRSLAADGMEIKFTIVERMTSRTRVILDSRGA